MLDLITFFIFLGIIAILVIKDRKNIKFQGLLLMRKTEKGREFVNSIAKIGLIKKITKIALIIGFLGMIYASYIILLTAYNIASGKTKEGAVILLPGPVSEAKFLPGMLIVPWYFWVIGIASVVISHELFHGIFSRSENIKVKSFGLFLFLIFPGAFCEPDEKQLKKSKPLTKIKIYAAGSFANFCVAFLSLLFTIVITSSLYEPYGIGYYGLINNSPAYYSNLSGIITEINGIRIKSLKDFSNILEKISPGEKIIIKTTKGNFSLNTAKHPENETKSFIGIASPYSVMEIKIKSLEPFIDFILSIFLWIYFLNLNIGLINLLPIKPLDGGLIFEEIAKKINKKKVNLIVKVTSFIFAALLFFIVVYPIVLRIF
jgi:membrane-associated protease RseP (regulator of RpoE activity)